MRIVVGGEGRDSIEAAIAEADEVIAPTLITAEIGNALWKYVRAGAFDAQSAVSKLTLALNLLDRQQPLTESITAEAIKEATRCGHPVYDLLYVVTARRNAAAALATADKRLAQVANRLHVETVGV
jgi:predicted nucleic acid-binding protein